MSATNSTLPNPIVYLNYLPPEVASAYLVSQAVYVATLGATVWDILSCLPQDWKLLRISKLTPPYIAYHISRWFSLAYVTLWVLSCTGAIRDCNIAHMAICACLFLTTSASDFLFLARVRAVYYSGKRVRLIFLFLWIIDACVISVSFWGVHDSNIADTWYCIHTSKDKYLVATMLVPLFFDSMVFIFITVKLMSTQCRTEKFNFKVMLSGKTFSRLPRALFNSGQQYYLIKICCCILMTTIWLVPSVPPALQTSVVVPSIAVTSSMACRVYRNLRLQSFDDECSETTAPLITDVILTTCIRAPTNVSQPFVFHKARSRARCGGQGLMIGQLHDMESSGTIEVVKLHYVCYVHLHSTKWSVLVPVYVGHHSSSENDGQGNHIL